MPYGHLIPNDLSVLSSNDLKDKHRELGYRLDTLRGVHTPEAEVERMKIDVARERIDSELRHRSMHV